MVGNGNDSVGSGAGWGVGFEFDSLGLMVHAPKITF
jgi:hypothetical protein